MEIAIGIIGMGIALSFIAIGYIIGLNDGKSIKVDFFRDGGRIVTERGTIQLVDKEANHD